jgi:hypothetical protein
VKVQGLLERACYSFGEKKMEDVLQKEGWDCAEHVELNQWPRIFRCNMDKLSADILLELGKPVAVILESVTQLRHTAVHRVRITVTRVEQFLIDSELLARLLEDDTCVRSLSRLRRETLVTIDEIKRNKDLLESNLTDKMKGIAVQRAELDNLERVAVDDMLREDKEYQTFAGGNLVQAIFSPDTIQPSATGTEPEVVSDEYNDADSDEQEADLIIDKTSWSDAAAS